MKKILSHKTDQDGITDPFCIFPILSFPASAPYQENSGAVQYCGPLPKNPAVPIFQFVFLNHFSCSAAMQHPLTALQNPAVPPQFSLTHIFQAHF